MPLNKIDSTVQLSRPSDILNCQLLRPSMLSPIPANFTVIESHYKDWLNF